MKKLIFLLFLFLSSFLVDSSVFAVCQINLAKPKDLINTRNVTLSYVTLDTVEGTGLSKIDFYYRKDGGSDLIKTLNTQDLSGEQVINLDNEGKYYFSAKAYYDNGDICQSAEVSTTIDTVGPSPLVSFGFARKDGSSTAYEICFKAPSDSDVTKVRIYRSDKEEFTADSGSEIHSEDILPNEGKCWVNDGLESGKNYYYAARVFDKAGNASDPSYFTKTKTETIYVTPTPGVGGEVLGKEVKYVETKEGEGGEVLGEEKEATPESTKEEKEKEEEKEKKWEGKVLSAIDQILPKSTTTRVILIAAIVVLVGGAAYLLLKKKEE